MDITFKDVSYIYQQNTPFQHKALDQVSFHIPSCSFVAIIGHTGSAKSTPIQHLNGLVSSSKGDATIGNFHLKPDKKPKNMKEHRSYVGVVVQYPQHQITAEDAEKDIACGAEEYGVLKTEIDERMDDTIPAVGSQEELLERSPFDLSGRQMR